MSDSFSGSSSSSSSSSDAESDTSPATTTTTTVAADTMAAVDTTQQAPAVPKKKKTAFADSGEVKTLFTASVLKAAVHELGLHIAGTVPVLINSFLAQTLKYYGTRANAAFPTAPSSSSLTIELKPTLVDAFVGEFKLTPKRRTEVKTSAKNACAFLLENAILMCKNQNRKTVSDTDVVTAAQITKSVIKFAPVAAVVLPVVVAAVAAPKTKKPAATTAADGSVSVAAAKKARERKKKSAAVSQAVVLDDGDDDTAALVTSGPNVPPPKAKAKDKMKASKKRTHAAALEIE